MKCTELTAKLFRYGVSGKRVTACVNANLIGTYGETHEFLLYLHSVYIPLLSPIRMYK